MVHIIIFPIVEVRNPAVTLSHNSHIQITSVSSNLPSTYALNPCTYFHLVCLYPCVVTIMTCSPSHVLSLCCINWTMMLPNIKPFNNSHCIFNKTWIFHGFSWIYIEGISVSPHPSNSLHNPPPSWFSLFSLGSLSSNHTDSFPSSSSPS